MSTPRFPGGLIAGLLASSLALAGCGGGSAARSEQAEPVPVETPSTAEASTSSAPPTVATSAPGVSGADGSDTTDGPSDDRPVVGPGADADGRYRGPLAPRVVATHPHDPSSFTQGLEWYDGRLLESTGLRGRSSLRLVDVASGEAEVLAEVDDDLFAEGVTVVDDDALQLTWQEGALLVTDLDDGGPAVRRDGAYRGEGWGLCFDGTRLVMSDGSSRLTFRDPATFEATGSVEVTSADGAPVEQLNELECVAGQVWANVWLTDWIAVIDPATGAVEATVDASSLVPDGVDAGRQVLNGIAHHPDTGRFWLTGKEWPVLYEVELVPAGDDG